MSLIGDLFNLLLLQPIINYLVLLIRLLDASSIPGVLGVAIILLTVSLKLILLPFTAAQIRSAKKLADLRPHMDQLKQKHGSDKQALAAAQLALFKEHNYNPAAGCLPAIAQLLIIYPLYQVIIAFLDPVSGLEKINYFLYNSSWRLTSLPDTNFLGVNLSTRPSEFASAGAAILLYPLLSVVSQYVLSKMMAPIPVKEYPSDSPKEKKEKETTEDAMASMQSQMTVMMPLVIGFIGFTLPAGLSLYWIVLNLVSIWQQYQISGWGSFGKEDFLKRFRR